MKGNGKTNLIKGCCISLISIIFYISLTTEHCAAFTLDSNGGSELGTPLTAAMNLAQYLTSETYYPMVHYKKNDWEINFMPAYFDVSYLGTYEEARVNGDNFKGWGFGTSFNYAISNGWHSFISYSQISMKGKTILSGNNGILRSGSTFYTDGTVFSNTALIGISYDIIKLFSDNSKWSMPVCFGGRLVYFNAEYDAAPVVATNFNQIYLNITSASTAFSIIGAASISRYFSISGFKIDVTPYVYFAPPPAMKYKATATQDFLMGYGTVPKGYKFEDARVANPGFIFPGLRLSLVTGDHWSFSLSLNGFLGTLSDSFESKEMNFYNNTFLKEMEMKSISLSVTYKSGIVSD